MIWLRLAGLRLALAFGLGFALWVFVSYTQNPERRVPFDSVPVSIEGLSPGLVVVDKDGLPRAGLPPVNVTVEADAETLTTLRESDLRAYADLGDRGPGEHIVQVRVETIRSDLRRLSFIVEPAFLAIRLDQEITRQAPLRLDVSGAVPFSFEQGQPRATLLDQPIVEARVRGPQSRVERVAYVRATADINQLTANYNSPRPLDPISQDGELVKGVVVEPTTVDVLVPIVSSAGTKRVPVVPSVIGEPNSGYVVTSVQVEPQFVFLTGSSGPLDSVQNVETQPVDISGASATISRTMTLQDPPFGTSLRAGEPITAVVMVQITPIERPFQLALPVALQIVNVGDGLLFSLSSQAIQVTFVGSAPQLAALDPAQLQGTVNARGLGPGVHTLTPSFALPPGITLVGEPRVTLTLRLPPTATPEPTPTPTLLPESTSTPTAQPTTSEPTPTAGATESPTPTVTPRL